MSRSSKKVIEIWYCDYCDKEFETEEEADNCEEKCEAKIRREEFREVFPHQHKEDTMYRRFCVDCGVLLSTWEDGGDHHRSYPGARHDHQKWVTRLGGYRCESCDESFKLMLVDAVREYKDRHNL